MLKLPLLLGGALAALSLPGLAANDVLVTVTGTVSFNQINGGVLGNVSSGDAATLTFLLDSTDFANSPNFPTRGYVVDQSSCQLDFGGGNSLGLQSPFPGGETPYFVLRNNDPAVDGFYFSTNLDGPIGVPIDQTGGFGQFRDNFYVTYGGSTLSSLDLLDALGTYRFTGLSVYNWTIDDGPFNAMEIGFEELTIALAGPSSYCDPANANSVSAGGAVLTSTGGYGTATAGFQVTGVPDQPGILFTGMNDPGALPFGCGVRCVAGSVIRYGTYLPSGNSLSVTIDMSSSPNSRIQYWYRDPAHAPVCGDTFNLSNALVQ